jgi:hypothetical protein
MFVLAIIGLIFLIALAALIVSMGWRGLPELRRYLKLKGM